MLNDNDFREPAKDAFTVMLEVDTLDRGGLENVVYDLATQLDQSLFKRVVVCVNGGGHIAEKLEKEGVRVEILPQEDKEKAFLTLLNRYDVDLLMPHHSFVGAPLAHRMNVPVLAVLHNMYVWFDKTINSELREQDPFVKKYAAVSKKVRDYIVERYKIPSEKIETIPNGIDTRKLEDYVSAGSAAPSRRDWGFGEDDLILLNVAATSPVKNQNLIVEALRAVRDGEPGVKVVCVGKALNGSYRQFIKEKVQTYGLEKQITFIDFTDRIYDLYRIADVFLLPSFIEGWSLAAMEAYCFGLPMILSDVGSAQDLSAAGAAVIPVNLYPEGMQDLDNDAIYRRAHEAPASDIDALAEAIRHAVRERRNRRVTRDIDLSRARAFSLEGMVRSYERLMLRIIAQAGKTARKQNGDDLRDRLEHLFRELYDQKKTVIESGRSMSIFNEQFLPHFQRNMAEQDSMSVQMSNDHHGMQSQLFDLDERMGRLEERLSTLAPENVSQLEQRTADIQYILNDILDRLSFRNRLESLKNRFRPKRLASRILHRPSMMSQNYKQEEGNPGKGGAIPERGLSLLQSSMKNEDITRFRYRKQLKEISRTLEKGYEDPKAQQCMTEILAKANPEKIVIYPSVIQWNHYLFQRPHQIFREMARRGVTIFFCTPDARTDRVRSVRMVEPNLYIAQSLHWVAPLRHTPSWIWVGWTASGAAASFFTQAKVIYELIDDLQLFPLHCDLMEQDHRTLTQTADVVLASADRLLSGVREYREDALLVTNGVAVDDFALNKPLAPPWDMKPIMSRNKPVVGYYGAISPWLDYKLIDELTKAMPQIEFVFIGPDYEGASCKLPNSGNVHWLGPKNYSELKNYLACFNVATIPFRSDEVTHAVSPLKLFEYMAGGKPVVARRLQEMAKYPAVLLADTVEEWAMSVKEALALEKNPEEVKLYRSIARENSWTQKVDMVQQAMEKADREHLRTRAL